MAQATFAYRLVGGNYPTVVLVDGKKETFICNVRWHGDRDTTIAKAEEVVKLLNEAAEATQ